MFFGFSGFNIMFTLVFILVMGTFVFVLVKGLSQWNKNNHSPVLTVQAIIVSKRAAYHHNAGEHAMGQVGITTRTIPPAIMSPSRLTAATGWSCGFPTASLATWWSRIPGGSPSRVPAS